MRKGKGHRLTRMTGPDCAVMCNLINIHTYIHTYIQRENGNGTVISPVFPTCSLYMNNWYRKERRIEKQCEGIPN